MSPEFKFSTASFIAFFLDAISTNLDLTIFFFIWFLIFFGFSYLGLSSVKNILLQYWFAILPIIGLLSLSLFPPQPKTIEIEL